MIAIAMGELGWSYSQVREAPVSFFIRAIVTHQKHQARTTRELHEIIRMHATVILNSFSKSNVDPTQVIGFSWDEKRSREKIRKEQTTRMNIYEKWLQESGYDISLSLAEDGKIEAKA